MSCLYSYIHNSKESEKKKRKKSKIQKASKGYTHHSASIQVTRRYTSRNHSAFRK